MAALQMVFSGRTNTCKTTAKTDLQEQKTLVEQYLKVVVMGAIEVTS